MKTFRKIYLAVSVITTLIITMLCKIQVNAKPSNDTYLKPEYVRMINDICPYYNMCPELIEALIETESGGNKYATSPHGAVGLCQLIPEYFYDKCNKYGYTSLYDENTNILLCIQYLEELFEEYEDPQLVLMIYNGGPSQVYYYTRCMNNSSSRYANRILERAAELERIHYGNN